MPFYRVSFKNVFDEFETADASTARGLALRSFKDYGATARDMPAFDVEEVCGGCFKVTCDCLPADTPCDPE